MCLSRLNPTKVGTGYKVFRVTKDGWLNAYSSRSWTMHEAKPFDQWITDTNEERLLCDDSWQKYQTGFHIFKTRADARKYFKHMKFDDGFKRKLLKVSYEEVTAEGTQDWDHWRDDTPVYSTQVVVARKIYVHKHG